jgi:hypothetical protein
MRGARPKVYVSGATAMTAAFVGVQTAPGMVRSAAFQSIGWWQVAILSIYVPPQKGRPPRLRGLPLTNDRRPSTTPVRRTTTILLNFTHLIQFRGAICMFIASRERVAVRCVACFDALAV